MAYKTMLRQLISKWGVMSIDMQTALDSDMAVINSDGTKDYVEMDDGIIVEGSAEEVQNVENKEVADVQVEVEPQPQRQYNSHSSNRGGQAYGHSRLHSIRKRECSNQRTAKKQNGNR